MLRSPIRQSGAVRSVGRTIVPQRRWGLDEVFRKVNEPAKRQERPKQQNEHQDDQHYGALRIVCCIWAPMLSRPPCRVSGRAQRPAGRGCEPASRRSCDGRHSSSSDRQFCSRLRPHLLHRTRWRRAAFAGSRRSLGWPSGTPSAENRRNTWRVLIQIKVGASRTQYPRS